MSKTLTLKNIILLGALALVFAMAWIFMIQPLLGNAANPVSNLAGEPVDLIGTRVGTSTTGVAFVTNSATTSYPFKLGADKNNVALTVFPSVASTSAQGPNIRFNLAGSNDLDCSTASTTTGTLNPVLTQDIRWFDLTDNLRNVVNSLTPSEGTSTIAYTPSVGVGKIFTFTDLNSKCLKVDLSASGTVAQVQFMAK